MYDEHTIEQALALLGEGMSFRQVSDAMGGTPSPSTIRVWSLGTVPTGKRRPQCILTLKQKLAAIERVEAGESYRDVAADIGCSAAALSSWRSDWKAAGPDALRTRYDSIRP